MALITAGHHSRQWLRLLQSAKPAGAARWCSGTPTGAVRAKKPEQMSDDELKQSLPSMLFTTGNLIWSTTLAVGVAAGGLLAMFWVGTFITGAAKSLRHLEETPQTVAIPPPPQKSLAELIAERKSELEAQLLELQQLPRTAETKQALQAVKQELRQYRDPATSWWRWW